MLKFWKLKHLKKKRSIIVVSSILTILILCVLWFSIKHSSTRYDPATAIQKNTLNGLMDSIKSNYYKIPVQRMTYINKAIVLADELSDTSALSKLYYFKGSCCIDLEMYDSVIPYCEKARILAIQLDNKILIAKIKNLMANLYLDKDDYYMAMVALKDALVIFEEKGDKHDIGVVYNGLGLVYMNLKDYDIAIDYYLKANEIFDVPGAEREQAVINLNIAGCYVEKNNKTKANAYFQEALKTFRKVQDSAQIVATYINMSNACRKNKDSKQASSFLSQAMVLSQMMNNQRLYGTALYNRGELLFDEGDFANAKNHVEKGLVIFRKIGLREGEMSALETLSEIYGKQGDYKRSMDYYKQFITVQNTLLNGNTRKQIADLQWKYNIQKKDLETKILEEKYKVKQRQTLFLTISFGLFVIFVLLIGLVIRLGYKNLKKSVRLKEMENLHLNEKLLTDQKINHLEHLRMKAELDARNKELTTTSLQLISKNEILVNISALNEQYFRKDTISREPYNILKQLLKENLNQDKDWVYFKELFERVHQNFFRNVKKLCPDLTENELRICAYLKINLRNKEIAKILNILPESVKTTRYHIRKKLNIDKEISLEDFIRNI